MSTTEDTQTYSADRPGLMEAAQSLVKREEEHAEPSPEPVDVPAELPPVTEKKEAVSLSEWRQEKTAEREAFERFRQHQEETPAELADDDEAPEQADPDDELLRRLTEPDGRIAPEDYQRALELSGKRLESQLYAAQVQNANAVYESRSRMQAASSTFGVLQQQLRGEFQNRFGADFADEAALRGVFEGPRASEAASFVAEANRVLAPHAHEMQQHQAGLAEANAHWGQFQDADFERRIAKSHPELKGEARDRATQRAVELLHSEGLSDEDISELWNGGAVPFRHAAMQSVLLKAVLWDQAQEKKATAVRRPVPPVLAPSQFTSTANSQTERAPKASAPSLRQFPPHTGRKSVIQLQHF